MTLHDQNNKNGKKVTLIFLGIILATSIAFLGGMYQSYKTRPDVQIEDVKK